MLSVIIPTYNEEDYIGNTIAAIRKHDKEKLVGEIIVSDGGSRDNTIIIARDAGASTIVSTPKSRARQMNAGASFATGEILYFIHADCIPPDGFSTDIVNAVNDKCKSGCFRLSFDRPHWFLKANSWFTRFNINNFRFGDQSLFIAKDVFKKAGGFDERLTLLEDQEIIYRIKKHTKFKVLPQRIITSARKYETNGVYKTQAVYFLIYCMYKMGFGQSRLSTAYKALSKQDKV